VPSNDFGALRFRVGIALAPRERMKPNPPIPRLSVVQEGMDSRPFTFPRSIEKLRDTRINSLNHDTTLGLAAI
jgi:hypothetical protein